MIESPKGNILQRALDGQYWDAEPEDELLELLEELLEEALEELLLELLFDELLLALDEELLLDELDELPEEPVPPQPISSKALTEARQKMRRLCKLNMTCPLYIYVVSGHPMPVLRQRQAGSYKTEENLRKT